MNKTATETATPTETATETETAKNPSITNRKGISRLEPLSSNLGVDKNESCGVCVNKVDASGKASGEASGKASGKASGEASGEAGKPAQCKECDADNNKKCYECKYRDGDYLDDLVIHDYDCDMCNTPVDEATGYCLSCWDDDNGYEHQPQHYLEDEFRRRDPYDPGYSSAEQ